MKQSTRWLVPGPSEDQSGENDARKRSSRAVPTSHGMSCQQIGCQQGSKNLTENAAGIFRLFWQLESEPLYLVMAGLVPAIHAFPAQAKQDGASMKSRQLRR